MSTDLILAITKIGDLLHNRRITQGKDGKAIEDINLTIPDYQRPYKWTAKNAIQLLDDILEAKSTNKEVYRVGTLILHQEERKGMTYDIVDGQQRVITFSLLLEVLDESVGFLEQSLADNPHNRHNVPNNYWALKRRIKSISDEKGKIEILDYVKEQCELIVVITKNISEAFQFFDSQNARGKKLYPHDLLKAYHLREMKDLDVVETERIVKEWEDLDQKELSDLFSRYLYCVKEWTKGNKAWELNEHNIHKFKGISKREDYLYAQFYKGAHAYAEMVNKSDMPFVAGCRELKPFQLDTPIIAGKPFFDYAKHYFAILEDIQDNDKYEGYIINDNEILRTLNLPAYQRREGDKIARLLFDTALLLYVDRFYPERPTRVDVEMLDQFLVFAFIWAYSLRAQYYSVRWASAQNYIMGDSKTGTNQVANSFNIYKVISEADTPTLLLSELSGKLNPLPSGQVFDEANKEKIDDLAEGEDSENKIFQSYLHYFKEKDFWEDKDDEKDKSQ
jgi:hypothetical protein